MSLPGAGSDSTDDLQFAVVEPAPPVAPIPVGPPPVGAYRAPAAPSSVMPARACIGCRQPITSSYYALGDKLICPACYTNLVGSAPGSAPARFIQATVMGIGAGLAGALVWFLVRRYANLQIGLIAVLVGYMVAKAVRKGSGGRGGKEYQVMAVVVTYCCIAANYMPDLIQGALANIDHPLSGAQWVSLVALSYKFSLELPFLLASSQPIGLLIVGIALYEAWKLSKSRLGAMQGPFTLGAGPGLSGAQR